jgi:hypothetical protein
VRMYASAMCLPIHRAYLVHSLMGGAGTGRLEKSRPGSPGVMFSAHGLYWYLVLMFYDGASAPKKSTICFAGILASWCLIAARAVVGDASSKLLLWLAGGQAEGS